MKSKIIIGILAISMIGVSCKKLLTADSPSLYTLPVVFSSSQDASLFVNGIYALFNTDAFTSRVANAFTADNDIEVGSVAATLDGGRRDLWSFEATAGIADLLTVWNNAYLAINKSNEAIEGINNSALYQSKDPAMLQLKGEVVALRAYWYYLLINNWGDVPYSDKPTRSGDNFYQPATDRNVILSHLIDDLIAVEPNMKFADQLDYGIERINREFVMGLIARISLERGGYALYPDMTMRRASDYLDYYKKANDYCRKLMTLKPHTLDPVYYNVFLNENKYIRAVNSDVLYEVAFAPGSGDVGWATGVTVIAGTHPYGSTTINLTFTPSYYHSFDTLDVRLPATCSIIYYDTKLQQTPVAITGGIAPAKWNRILVPTALGSQSAKGTGINWPLMRYSDILLMLAESDNEIAGSPTNDAKNALKLVRQRAFPAALWPTKVDAYITTVSASKQTFFDAIVNERAWEFGGEMLRKYDLARWNYYGKKVAETRNTINQMGADANSGSGTYSNLPNIVYYKLNTDLTCTFYNKYKRVIGGAPTGYTALNWTIGLYSSTNGGPSNYANYSWRGYKDNSGLTPLRYIYPYPSTVVAASNGTLSNNGYGYTN